MDTIQSLPEYTEIIVAVDGIVCYPDCHERAGLLWRSRSETMGWLRFLQFIQNWEGNLLSALHALDRFLSASTGKQREWTSIIY